MFKIGDRVKVVRKVTKQQGWNNSWNDLGMTQFVNNGQTYRVWDVRDSGIYLESGTYYGFPSDALELVGDMEKISLNNNYKTKHGAEVKLFEITDNKVFGKVNVGGANGWVCAEWNDYGESINPNFDLVKIGKYDHIKIDDQVIVWDNHDENRRLRRYFAGINEEGMPLVWDDGRTSWTADDRTSCWDNCELFVE